jgi:hypothetical protein
MRVPGGFSCGDEEEGGGESASTDAAAGRGRAAASCIVPRSFRGVVICRETAGYHNEAR